MRPHLIPFRGLGVALAVVGVGCAGDDPGPTAPEPAVTLQVAASELHIAPGGTALLPVTVVREGGFVGAVTVTSRTAPAGVTVDPSVIPEGVGTGTVAFRAQTGAPEGSGAASLEAIAAGLSRAGEATVQVTVEARDGEAVGGFSLSLEPGALSIRPGQSDSVRVTLARTSPFDGPVRLEVTGLPKDVSALVDPASVSGAEAVVLVEVGADATLGDASLTVVGTAEGVDDQSVELVLTTFGS